MTFQQSPRRLVSIITVHFNQGEATRRLLDSVRTQRYAPVEVWVADNGSHDGFGTLMQTAYPEFGYLRSETNRGFAGGNNMAMEQARGDLVFLVNNDARLTPECIETLADFLEKNPHVGAVSPLICHDTPDAQGRDRIQYAGMNALHPLTGRNRTQGQWESDQGQYAAPFPTAYAHGAAMMLTRKALQTVGMMPETYFLYYEELDWCERIRRAGLEIWVVPQAKVYHAESLTLNQLGDQKTFYLARNRIWFMRRWSAGLRLVLFFLYISAIATPVRMLRSKRWSEALAHWRGLLAGLGSAPPAAPSSFSSRRV